MIGFPSPTIIPIPKNNAGIAERIVSITKKAFSFFGGLAITTAGAAGRRIDAAEALPGDGNPLHAVPSQ
jgi:hypothetical protein